MTGVKTQNFEIEENHLAVIDDAKNKKNIVALKSRDDSFLT